MRFEDDKMDILALLASLCDGDKITVRVGPAHSQQTLRLAAFDSSTNLSHSVSVSVVSGDRTDRPIEAGDMVESRSQYLTGPWEVVAVHEGSVWMRKPHQSLEVGSAFHKIENLRRLR